jgi:hypothetical protein
MHTYYHSALNQLSGYNVLTHHALLYIVGMAVHIMHVSSYTVVDIMTGRR